MSQSILCPHCQRQLSIRDELAGKRLSCPHCKKPFLAPAVKIPEAIRVDELPKPIVVDEPESELDFLNNLSVPTTPVPSNSHGSSGYRGSSRTREYRRTCQRCGTVWHSLVSREKKVKQDQTCNNCQVVTCNPTQQKLARANFRQSSERELDRLRKCPNCQSSVYDEELL